jgi:hypothetical protein
MLLDTTPFNTATALEADRSGSTLKPPVNPLDNALRNPESRVSSLESGLFVNQLQHSWFAAEYAPDRSFA